MKKVFQTPQLGLGSHTEQVSKKIFVFSFHPLAA